MANIDVYGYDQDDLGPIEARTATLQINFKEIGNYNELNKTILHEMLHVLLSKIVATPDNVTNDIAIEQVIRTLEDAIWHFHLKAEE